MKLYFGLKKKSTAKAKPKKKKIQKNPPLESNATFGQ